MVLEKLKSIISQQLDVDEDEINESTTFEDLGADSLDIVEFIMVVEEEFDIEIADEDAEGMSTVGDVVEYISSHT